ncbi:hypothetical protein [Pseudomonas chlororaphis]|uniref:hypothetical protein n=1 Tax=Pseudomonas chlororaphis TaxID=587753 RepID=UPI0024085B99|nr:hypothetical protein [Pseudomonas chlororaphis]
MQHLVELASAVVIAGTGAGEDLQRGSASPPGTGRHAAGVVIEHGPGRPPALVCFSSWIYQALHQVTAITDRPVA